MKQDNQAIKQNNYKIGDVQSVFVTTADSLHKFLQSFIFCPI